MYENPLSLRSGISRRLGLFVSVRAVHAMTTRQVKTALYCLLMALGIVCALLSGMRISEKMDTPARPPKPVQHPPAIMVLDSAFSGLTSGTGVTQSLQIRPGATSCYAIDPSGIVSGIGCATLRSNDHPYLPRRTK